MLRETSCRHRNGEQGQHLVARQGREQMPMRPHRINPGDFFDLCGWGDLAIDRDRIKIGNDGRSDFVGGCSDELAQEARGCRS